MPIFSIRRKQKVKMNFTGSPQCGNAGDMKFEIDVVVSGANLDKNGFLFDSHLLFEVFNILTDPARRWNGSCEGIGLWVAQFFLVRGKHSPLVESVSTTITTESGNQLTITIGRDDQSSAKHILKEIE